MNPVRFGKNDTDSSLDLRCIEMPALCEWRKENAQVLRKQLLVQSSTSLGRDAEEVNMFYVQ